MSSVQVIESKFQQEVHGLRTSMEANKNELIKYALGMLVGFAGVGFSAARFFL